MELESTLSVDWLGLQGLNSIDYFEAKVNAEQTLPSNTHSCNAYSTPYREYWQMQSATKLREFQDCGSNKHI